MIGQINVKIIVFYEDGMKHVVTIIDHRTENSTLYEIVFTVLHHRFYEKETKNGQYNLLHNYIYLLCTPGLDNSCPGAIVYRERTVGPLKLIFS